MESGVATGASSMVASDGKTAASTVAVIGAGPGGLFFCHAFETYRRELVEQGDLAALANLPLVTCFDSASGPGGLWRLAEDAEVKRGSRHGETNVYEAFWTNGPKEAIEFFDYTYDEHFGGRPLPVYLPRWAMLEYMVGRVTKHCPEFLDKYTKFNTGVESVRFLEAEEKFEIVTKDSLSEQRFTEYYDKCIWAAGMNGRPMMPTSIFDMLREGGFSGKTFHSSETFNFLEDVKEKTILLIGGSYSAEDLALITVKCGANMVYISSRNQNVVSWTTAWPYNKVKVLEQQLPVRVTEDGGCIQFADAKLAWSGDDISADEVQTELHDVDTIIFCTGYLPNVDMLSEELRQAVCKSERPLLPVPKDWRMSSNAFTEVLGVVEPADDLEVIGCIYPGLFCGCISIANPRMMFMTYQSEWTLLGIDVTARLLMRFVTGLKDVPTAEETLKQEKEAVLHVLNNPGYRCIMDKNYIEAIEDNWVRLPDVPESKHEWLDEAERDFEATMDIRILIRYALEAEYPVNFGSIGELSDIGYEYLGFDSMTRDHRSQLTEEDAEHGRTYRDYSDGSNFVSVYTGAEATSLKSSWMDIAGNDVTILKP